MKSNLIRICIRLAVAVIAMSCTENEASTVAPPQPTAPPRAQAIRPVIERLSPAELADMVKTNAARTEAQLNGKLVEVTGIVSQVSTDLAGAIQVHLAAGGIFNDVYCSIRDAVEQKKALDLQSGHLGTVVGRFQGVMMNSPMLGDCKVAWVEPVPFTEKQFDQLQGSSGACAHIHGAATVNARGGLPDGGRATPEAMAKLLDETSPGLLAEAKATLAKSGLPALPCDHPAMTLMMTCVFDYSQRESKAKNKARLPPSNDARCNTPFVQQLILGWEGK